MEELFDKYLEGELSPKERIIFDLRLKNDTAFRQAFEQHKEFIQLISQGFLKSELEQIHQNGPIQDIHKSKLSRGFLLVASLLLITVSAFLLHYLLDNQNKLPAMMIDPGLPTLMSANNERVQFDNAMVAYKQKKYSEARTLLESIQHKAPNDTLSYYIGLTYLNEHDFIKAEEELKKEEVLNSERFGSRASYYLGYMACDEGDKEKAKYWLEKSDFGPAIALRDACK